MYCKQVESQTRDTSSIVLSITGGREIHQENDHCSFSVFKPPVGKVFTVFVSRNKSLRLLLGQHSVTEQREKGHMEENEGETMKLSH